MQKNKFKLDSEIKKRQVRKSISAIIITIFLMNITLRIDVPFAFTGDAPKVSSIYQLDKYANYNKTVILECSEVYHTGYEYYVDNVLKGYYLYVTLSNSQYNVIVVLVDSNYAEEYVQKSDAGEKVEILSEVSQGLDYNRQDIIDEYKQELISNDILDEYEANELFYNVSADAMLDPQSTLIIISLIMISLVIIYAIKSISSLIKVIDVNKHTDYKLLLKCDGNELDKIREVYEENNFEFKEKNIFISDEYLYKLSFFETRITKIDNIAWIYDLENRVNGIKTAEYIMIKLKHGKDIAIPVDKKKLQDIIEYLYSKNNEILIGYSNDNRAKYKEILKNNKVINITKQ